MLDDVIIYAAWDEEAKVWIATSDDIPGLVVETEIWGATVAEVPVVIDELLEVRGEQARPRRLTFKAEQRLDLVAA